MMNEASAETWKNSLPPRLQWNRNWGYCGEVSLICAGLYYGQYLSQYDVRAIASPNIPQGKWESQLLLGVNDQLAASKMHLKTEVWQGKNKSAQEFLLWIKENVMKGYPVLMGIYVNEYLYYGNLNPNAGDPEYDHIVPVIGITTGSGFDTIHFSDNGYVGNSNHPVYIYSYAFDDFLADRRQANSKSGNMYSLSNKNQNYGIAITGVMDDDHETLPIHLETNFNYEFPIIEQGSNKRPKPMLLTLKIIVEGLEEGVDYHLYRYNDINQVPHSHFNQQASKAFEQWTIHGTKEGIYIMHQNINSDEIAIYRAVKSTAH